MKEQKIMAGRIVKDKVFKNLAILFPNKYSLGVMIFMVIQGNLDEPYLQEINAKTSKGRTESHQLV